nr:retrotransposon protein [Tanacetum cinerariifolium]
MRTRSRSRHKIAEPLRIEFPSQEDQFQEDPPEVPMADNRTMAQFLQAPIVGARVLGFCEREWGEIMRVMGMVEKWREVGKKAGDFKKFYKRRGKFVTQSRNDKKTFQRSRDDKNGSWRDSGEEDDEKVKEETCLVAQASSEICLGVDLKPDEWIKDSGCSKHMMGQRLLGCAGVSGER